MPYAIVIHALPRMDLPITHAQGKVLHGLFYEILQNASAAKGDEVHSTDGLKPFWVRFRPDVIFKPHSEGPSTKNSPTAGIT
jgi:hypothetical protein